MGVILFLLIVGIGILEVRRLCVSCLRRRRRG